MGRADTGQVSRSTGRRDDDLNSPGFGARDIFGGFMGGAVGGKHAAFVFHPELMKGIGSIFHHFPVRLAAHQNINQLCHEFHPQLKEYGSKNTKIKNLFVIRLMKKIMNSKRPAHAIR
jgi:hypothetical protein